MTSFDSDDWEVYTTYIFGEDFRYSLISSIFIPTTKPKPKAIKKTKINILNEKPDFPLEAY